MQRPKLEPPLFDAATRSHQIIDCLRDGQIEEARGYALAHQLRDPLIETVCHLPFEMNPLASLQTLSEWASETPALQYSRLREIIACLLTPPTDESLRRFNLLVISLSAQSRRAWRQVRWHLLPQERLSLFVSTPELSINVYGEIVCLNAKRSLFQLLTLFRNQPEWNNAEAIARLWQATLDSSYFARLRRNVHRLNQTLLPILPVSRLIEIRSQGMRIHDRVDLTEIENF